MGEQELYRKYAGYYDLIYNWMDYPGEADFIKKAVSHHKTSGGNELFDGVISTISAYNVSMMYFVETTLTLYFTLGFTGRTKIYKIL